MKALLKSKKSRKLIIWLALIIFCVGSAFLITGMFHPQSSIPFNLIYIIGAAFYLAVCILDMLFTDPYSER